MYHGFDFSDGVGIGIQQTVDYGQFILGLLAQPYPNFVTVDGFQIRRVDYWFYPEIHGQFMVIRVKKSNNIEQQETTRYNGAK